MADSIFFLKFIIHFYCAFPRTALLSEAHFKMAPF